MRSVIKPLAFIVVSSLASLSGSSLAYANWTAIIRPALKGGSLSLARVAAASSGASASIVSQIIKSAVSSANGTASSSGGMVSEAAIRDAFYTQMRSFVLDSEDIIWTRSDLESLVSQVVSSGSMCGRATCQNALGILPSNPEKAIDDLVAQLENKVSAADDLISSLNTKLATLDPDDSAYLSTKNSIDQLQLQKADTNTALIRLKANATDDFDWIVEMLNTCRY